MSQLATTEAPIVTKQPHSPANPFAKQQAEHVNAGTVAIEEQRAIAEAQGKLVIAKRFPRDEFKAFGKIIESCKRQGLAEEATYAFPKGGKNVSGPSIRLAEELARVWGNIDYGIRELSRKDGVSEMEAYAWDLETNTSSSQKFTVKHWVDTQSGGRALKDERDIYEVTANQGARRLRARILAILPGDLVDAAQEQCRSTMAGNSDEPIADRVRNLIRAFDKLGISSTLIERKLGHSLSNILPEEIADLREIYNSIKNGFSTPSEWFTGENTPIVAASVPTQQPPPKAPAPEPQKQPSAPAPQEQRSTGPGRPRKNPLADKPAETPSAPPAPTPLPQEDNSWIGQIRQKLHEAGKTEEQLTNLAVNHGWLKSGQALESLSEKVKANLLEFWSDAIELIVEEKL